MNANLRIFNFLLIRFVDSLILLRFKFLVKPIENIAFKLTTKCQIVNV
jgi:hypothetical protein